MSTEKNNQQDKKSQQQKNTSVNNKVKKSGSIASKLSLVISLAAIGVTGYIVATNSELAKNSANSDSQYTQLIKQVEQLKQDQQDQNSIMKDVGSQSDSQTNSIKALQSQLNAMNSQIATPAKDLYMQVNVANIQSAIDYLTLAKDVVVMTGDTTKAMALIDMAFDKIEASNVANISASDRKNIKENLSRYKSKDDVVKNFSVIQHQIQKLEYVTSETLSDTKSKRDQNNYMKLLGSIIEVQDIPKDQLLVTSKQSRNLVADGLYNALITLQSAMYANSQKAIENAREKLETLIKKYFVQNDDAKSLEQNLANINAQDDKGLDDSIDKVITQLSKQQNELLSKNDDFSRDVASQKGSEK